MRGMDGVNFVNDAVIPIFINLNNIKIVKVNGLNIGNQLIQWKVKDF